MRRRPTLLFLLLICAVVAVVGGLLGPAVFSFASRKGQVGAGKWFERVGTKKHVYFVPHEMKPCLKKAPYLPPAIREDDTPLNKELTRRGYYVHETRLKKMPKDADVVVFDNMHVRHNVLRFFKRFPTDRMILVIWEPPSVIQTAFVPENQQKFSRILTWEDSLVDNHRLFKFAIPYPIDHPPLAVRPFEDKKLCVMVNKKYWSSYPKQLYSERHKVVEFYEQNHPQDFDLYGPGWQHLGLKTYRGPVADKLDCLSHYRFCMCYENTRDIQGYVTEKILDCFVAGCVPVYLGATNVTEYVPEDCFVDRRNFASDEEVYAFIQAMTPEEHAGYLERARRYLVSEQAQMFQPDRYIQKIADTIDQVANSATSKNGLISKRALRQSQAI